MTVAINGLDPENLMKVVETVKHNWEVGRTVWKASTTWKGGFKVETCSREFTFMADEPEMPCGTNTAANPVEMILQAYGACLSIGYAMNAAVRGIRIDDIKIDLEGEIDLPGFLGLEPPEKLHMDKLPGFKTIKAKMKIKADADEKSLLELHKHVVNTSPVGLTLKTCEDRYQSGGLVDNVGGSKQSNRLNFTTTEKEGFYAYFRILKSKD